MDYYAVLGVSPGCSLGDVKVAYRKLALRFHPDRPGCNQGVIFQYIVQVRKTTLHQILNRFWLTSCGGLGLDLVESHDEVLAQVVHMLSAACRKAHASSSKTVNFEDISLLPLVKTRINPKDSVCCLLCYFDVILD